MKKTIIISSIAVLVGLLVGYFWGFAVGGANVKASYASKIEAVSKLFPPVPSELTAINGKIEKIDGNTITITANNISQNPFSDINFPTTRVITISSDTKLVKSVQKDPATFQKEMAAFQLAMQNGQRSASSAPIMPPTQFGETNINLSDLKAGDVITATASNNILSASSFTATKIQVQ
jgi:hypothetical protein